MNKFEVIILVTITFLSISVSSKECTVPIYSCINNLKDLEAGDPRIAPYENEIKKYLKTLKEEDLNTDLKGYSFKNKNVIFKRWKLVYFKAEQHRERFMYVLKDERKNEIVLYWDESNKTKLPNANEGNKALYDCINQNEPTTMSDGEIHTGRFVGAGVVVFHACAKNELLSL